MKFGANSYPRNGTISATPIWEVASKICAEAGDGALRRISRAEAMKKALLIWSVAGIVMAGAAKADRVDLSPYADANGFIDVQALTCAQLANANQEDTNALIAWYSGWYNGLAQARCRLQKRPASSSTR
jgi:hypothetical protein